MQIFYEKKGAISVFLSVILLPMLIVALLATDAARIYSAKSVIADAGEMAMNAALAQYNAKLKDEYGLIAMDKEPSSMQGDLEKYFTASLNGDGLSNSGNYKQVLDLMEQSFEVIDVEASKVYKTEVEKQQILEYMKYRAPVCMADMVLDKIDQIKDNKKMIEAMEAEADFAEAMEECQDAFEDAKNKLDELNEQLKYFPYDSKINQDLDSTEMEYKRGGLSMAFMIRAAIGHYDDYNKTGVQNASTTQQKFDLLNGAMTSFINAAKQVSLGNPLDETSYNQFMAAMYYKNTMDALGGEGNLLTWYDELNTPADDEESDEEDSSSGGEDQARKDLSDSITDYKNKRDAIMPGYKQSMDQYVRTNVYKWGDTLNNYWTSAQSGEIRAKNAKDALNIVKEKLENAAEKHAIWKEKTDALSNPGSMKDEVEKYENMFDTTKCEQLINKVESDEATFKRIQEELKGEKFFDQSLATVDRGTQMQKFSNEASYVMDNRDCVTYDEYSELKFICDQSYRTGYVHIHVTYVLQSIENDEFYKQLIEYCKSRESAEKNEKQEQANETLDQGKEGAETTSGDETGVYPNATGLTEVAMGVTEDICTFKAPLNYVLAGGYYDENNEEQTIEGLNSATTTVEEALAAGSFSTGNHLAFFTMTSLDADQTMITTGMYTPDIMSWDDFKTYYPDAKEIGDTNVPGLLYHVEAISGQSVAVAVKVSDDVTLQIVYEGSLEDEIGEDELGQRLYNLVTVK